MYRKLLLNLIIISFIITIVVIGINYLFINTYYYKSSVSSDSRKFDHVPNNIVLANFGSSHGLNGFDYSELNKTKTTFNFALSSQTPRYDYIIFKKYVDNFDHNSVVIFPISYFSLYEKNPGESVDFKLFNRQYYGFLDHDLIDNYKFSEKILSEIPALSAKFDLKYIFFDLPEDINFEISINNDKVSRDLMGLNRANGHLKRIDFLKNSQINSLRPTPIMYDSYIKIIDLCKSKGIAPVFITTPYLETYSKHFSKEFKEQFYKDIDSLCKYGDISYYDYSNDNRFISNYKYYLDTDHLNKSGAKEFTREVVNDLIDKGLLSDDLLEL